MRLALIGSQVFKDPMLAARVVAGLPRDTTVITGNRFGPERAAVEAAMRVGLQVELVEVSLCQGAGYRLTKNSEILEHHLDFDQACELRDLYILTDADRLICFEQFVLGRSTADAYHAIRLARDLDVFTTVITADIYEETA